MKGLVLIRGHSPHDGSAKVGCRRPVGCTLALLLVLGAAAFFFIYALGHRETGEVDLPADVPVVGRRLSTFHTNGSIAYSIFYGPHGRADYLLCGYTSEDHMRSVWETPGIEVSSTGGDQFNGSLANTVKFINGDASDMFFKGGFEDDDCLVFGHDPFLGRVVGAFRKRDGYFAVKLVGVRPWLKNKAGED